MRVPFGALDADYRAKRVDLDAAVLRVLASGRFVLGDEVAAFEREFAAHLGARHVVSCGSGTDAVVLALQAAGAGPDDAVLLPANTCVPTLAAVRLAGARPRLADVDDRTLTLDASSAAASLHPDVRFLLPVHLYGGVADLAGLGRLADERGLQLVEDCAQSHGASLDGKKTGTFGRTAAFSFYPSKNLGAYGDGGAVATDDAALAERLRRLRQYGWSRRDFSIEEGRNSRLDELQAAILRAKLVYLEPENTRRRAIAALYDTAFRGLPVQTLAVRPGAVSARHLYPIRVERRDALREHLANQGIETGIHYSTPLHLQPAYAFLGYRSGDFPVAEKACATILSLPIAPTLSDAHVDAVIAGVRSFFGETA